MSEKEKKAKKLVKEKKVTIDIINNKRLHFTVNSNETHTVIFDKQKIGWSCDCKHSSVQQKTCSHIIACKEYYESSIKHKAEIELSRVKYALSEVKLVETNKKTKDLLELIKSYAKDSEYFYEKKDYLESFELSSYVFGLLDSAARLGVINPGKAKTHYKIE